MIAYFPFLMGPLALTLSIIVGGLIYWTPTMVAFGRRSPFRFAIGGFNFFLGWTLVGWFGALIWALKPSERPV
ncbi:MAG: superinfection immunity protein [Nitrosospira sp.]